MSLVENSEKYKNQVLELEKQLSDIKLKLQETKLLLDEESEKLKFYQFVADFTFGWELWFEQSGKIKYCSPSCFDLTGYTANEIITSENITELLVYQSDREKYSKFLSDSVNQLLVTHSLEFRILTRTKQLRWCIMNVRGVYDSMGKYLGIRASVQDITKLKKAMGQIHEMESVKVLETRTKQRLQNQLDIKDRELVSFLLQLSQKNELLSKISGYLKSAKNTDADKNKSQLNLLLMQLDTNTASLIDWSMVENQVEKLHPGFLSRLQIKHPVISHKDKKLCAYLRLGLTSRDISGLMNITTKSVEIARIRLRKKLKISDKTRLSSYLIQL